MTNTSASGGYLVPSSNGTLPGGRTITQFIHDILMGISGLNPTLVRPRWQVKPPNQPDIDVNWLAFGVNVLTPDANAWVGINNDGASTLIRYEQLEVQCSFYGPDANELSGVVRDGFQIQQNLEAMRAAKIGFAYCNEARPIPDLVNERWVSRTEMSVFLRRERQRVYPVLEVLSAEGTIRTVVDGEELVTPWSTEETRD